MESTFEFYELDKAKRAAKALMNSTNDKESNYIVQVGGDDIELNGDAVFGVVDFRFNGTHWVADIDGKEYRDSRFHFGCDPCYFLIVKH